MSFKEHFKSVMSLYFVIVTLINGAMFILGKVFRPEEKFGYEVMLSPLVYAAIALIPMLCMYSKKELTLKQNIIKELFTLLALEVILVSFGLGVKCLSRENLPLTAGFALSVLIIFVLVNIIAWLLDLKLARQLNSDLKEFQSRFSEDSDR